MGEQQITGKINPTKLNFILPNVVQAQAYLISKFNETDYKFIILDEAPIAISEIGKTVWRLLESELNPSLNDENNELVYTVITPISAKYLCEDGVMFSARELSETEVHTPNHFKERYEMARAELAKEE